MTITINRERLIGILIAIILIGVPAILVMAEGLERRAQQQEMTNSAISGLECTYNGDCD